MDKNRMNLNKELIFSIYVTGMKYYDYITNILILIAFLIGNKEISSSSDAFLSMTSSDAFCHSKRMISYWKNSLTLFFELSFLDNKIRIRGNDNVSLAYGFNYYLRYY